MGIEVKFKHCEYPVYINPSLVNELTSIQVGESGCTIGAAVTLSEIENTCFDLIDRFPEHKVRIFKQIAEMLHWFAGIINYFVNFNI